MSGLLKNKIAFRVRNVYTYEFQKGNNVYSRLASAKLGAGKWNLFELIAETIFNENRSIEKIASLVKLNIKNSDCPQYQFSWKNACEQDLVTEEVTPSLLHILNGKGHILADGVIKVEDSKDKHSNLLFTIDRDLFIKEVLIETFNNVSTMKVASPVLNNLPTRKVIVEYSSPNIAKPFHVGHLRSTIIGQVLANLQRYLGNQVTRINYLGDWGTQYGVLSAGYDRFASDEELEKNPMEHLFNVYVASNATANSNLEFLNEAKAIFSQMEKGEEKYLKRWRQLKDISIIEFKKMYKRLGVHFDETHSESMYHKKAAELIADLLEKNIATSESNGAVKTLVDWPKQDPRPITLAKSDGASLYISRDAAAAIERKIAYNFDTTIYVVDKSQSDHFIALKSLLRKMGHDWADSLQHVGFGRILGMSTRKGEVVFLDELLDEAKRLALEAIRISTHTNIEADPQETAEVLGVSAVLINDLRLRRMNDYTFDWSRALHHKGDSGMELQYCHARLSTVDKIFGKLLTQDFDAKLLCEPEALNLTLHIARFDEALAETYHNLEPYILVMYLFKLNLLSSKAYRELIISHKERRFAESRYFLLHTARLVLHQGMLLLGLKPLEKM